MQLINTVLGEIKPEQLGFCHIHDHVWVDSTPAADSSPKFRLNRYDASLQELNRFKGAGGRALVDAQPLGAGRSVDQLAALGCESGVWIIASTGYHRPLFYAPGHWLFHATIDHLTELFASEISVGCFRDGAATWPIDRAPTRAGVVKAAVGAQIPDPQELNMLRAAACAAQVTGAALMVHVESASAGLVVLAEASHNGLQADRVIICHADRQIDDLPLLRKIAEKGAYLDFDTIARPHCHDDAAEIRLILQLFADGLADRLMLSLDSTSERLTSYGGTVGLDDLAVRFLPQLIRSGLTSSDIDRMMIINPAAVLTRRDFKEDPDT